MITSHISPNESCSHLHQSALSGRKTFIEELRNTGIDKKQPEYYRKVLLTYIDLLVSEMGTAEMLDEAELSTKNREQLESTIASLEETYKQYKFIRSEVVRQIY